MKTKRQKILYVITKGNWGGAQRYVFDLATSLPKDKYDCAVVFGEGEMLQNKLSAVGIRTIRIKSLRRDVSPILDLTAFRELRRIFEEEKPEVVHLNSSKIGALGALAARSASVPKIIFTGHGWAWNENRNIFSKILITKIHWLTIMLCHKTIAVCEQVKRQIFHLPFIDRKKIVVIHNGIDPILFEEKSAARLKIGGSSEKIWVGAVGELHKNKGFDLLIDAFSTLDHEAHKVGLYIIGEGEERENLEKQINERGVENHVHLVGFIDKAGALLKAFDIFAIPSRTEAFPYILLEAGLAQLPIVASNVGGISEVIENEKTGLLFSRGNVAELKKNMELLITDSSLSANISQSVRMKVENDYSRKLMAEKTFAIYNI